MKKPNLGVMKRKLFTGAKKGNVGAIAAALEAGVDVHALDGNKWTPLHEAARHGHPDAVRLLIERGADPNAVHRSIDYSVLFVATFSVDRVETVRALIEGGAAVSLATRNGFTPAHNTIENRDWATLRVLLAAGADPDLDACPNTCKLTDEEWDEVKAVIAEYVEVPKQTAEAAREIVAKTKPAAPPEPHREAKPLDPARVEVKGTPVLYSETQLVDLAPGWGTAPPTGYAAFMAKVGAGILNNTVRCYGPDAVSKNHRPWVERIREHWFWGDGSLLPQSDALDAIRIADTLDGHELVFHPRQPDCLMLLPHDDDEVLLISEGGYLPALTRLLELYGGRRRKRVFEANALL